MTTTKFPIAVWVSLLLTVILSFANLLPRYQVEQGNKAVTLVVESEIVDELAATQSLSYEEGLALVKAAGIGALSCNERSASELLNSGSISLIPQENQGFEVQGSPRDIEIIAQMYEARYGKTTRTEQGVLIKDERELKTLPLGLNPYDVQAAAVAQLPIVARLGNPAGTTSRYIQTSLRLAAENGAQYYLPLGEQALGNQALLKTTDEALKANKIKYVTAEFVKIAGDSTLVGLAPDNAVRLHAAQTAELVRMSQSAIVERYVKAARERNIRLLLIRPSTTASDTPLSEFGSLIKAIKQGLEKDGLAVKESRPFTDPESNPFLKLALGLAMVPALGFCLTALATQFGISGSKFVAWGIAGFIGVATYSSSLREYSALAGSILMPVLAYFWFLTKTNRNPLLSYLGISAICLVGGLQVAGLLTGLPYMLHLNLFTGVKLSVFLPIFIAGYLVMNSLNPIKKTLAQPIVWGTLGSSLLVLGVLAFMNSRTGNDNPAGVSGLELQLRNVLDQLLFVRPRTKEFMIGHPLLFMGLFVWVRTSKDTVWHTVAALLVVAGAIGQTSVVNTFCHLHTPIDLSLGRVVTGHLAGCILGALGWAVLHRFIPKTAGEEKN